MLVAEREIWLVTSRMLWAFEMTQVEGRPIDLSEYDGASGKSPVPVFVGLFEGVAKVLQRESGVTIVEGIGESQK